MAGASGSWEPEQEREESSATGELILGACLVVALLTLFGATKPPKGKRRG